MANALNREIRKGEQVVVRADVFQDFREGKRRVFVCMFGFGMQAYTLGSAIYGSWLIGSGATESISGMWIDAEETERLSLG